MDPRTTNAALAALTFALSACASAPPPAPQCPPTPAPAARATPAPEPSAPPSIATPTPPREFPDDAPFTITVGNRRAEHTQACLMNLLPTWEIMEARAGRDTCEVSGEDDFELTLTLASGAGETVPAPLPAPGAELLATLHVKSRPIALEAIPVRVVVEDHEDRTWLVLWFEEAEFAVGRTRVELGGRMRVKVAESPGASLVDAASWTD